MSKNYDTVSKYIEHTCIIGILEEERLKRHIQNNSDRELSKINNRHQTRDRGSSENINQRKKSNKYTAKPTEY